jgi:integrase
LELPTDEDRELLANFVLACMHQESIAIRTKRTYIISLVYLSRYLDHKKSFKDLSDKNISDYLGSFHKDQVADPDQKWINSCNTNASSISKFFRWVACPHLSSQERRKLSEDKLPPVLRGLVFVTKKGSKSSVKAKEIWYDQDNTIFLKYCADPRLRFYHALAIDTSGRPHELLRLKIGDIDIKKSPDGRQYVPLDIGRYGKKKKGRIVGMIHSIKYYREWLSHHPDAGNPNAYVFVSREFSAKYRNVQLSVDSVRNDYANFRDKYIPALLRKSDISPEDKIKLQEIKDNKKWYPYVMRHSSISKYARNPNINEYTLRQHAGWTKTSNMIDVYTHELGGEHFEDIMLACGIDLRDKKQQEQLQQQLQGKKCPYCSIENVPEARFCISCKFALDQLSSHELIEDAERNKREAEQTKKELAELRAMHEEGFRKMREEIASLRETNFMAFLRLKEEAEKSEAEKILLAMRATL